jgi:hypothetical protein
MDYIPHWLPCGIEVNRFWRPGKHLECCRTICPEKSELAIDICYEGHKYELIKKLGIKNYEEWLEIKDLFFSKKSKEGGKS